MAVHFARFVLKISLIFALSAGSVAVNARDMLVIAHRGASGERPEHTLSAYELAIDQGADYIEIDLVATKDLVLVARHENELSDSTDVASREEFDDRRRSKTVDGRLVSGWFAEDFTLAELRTLRAKERMPGLRPANARFDGLYAIPTFAEVVQLLRAKEAETGRTIGLYAELKHPNFLLQEAGIDSVDLLVSALREAELDDAEDSVFVESFEVASLRRLDRLVDTRLVLLAKPDAGPADEPALRYEDMLSQSGLAEVAKYADAVAVDLRMLLAGDGSSTGVMEAARAAGLQVHGWTLRKENAYLPPAFRKGTGEGAVGDLAGLALLIAAAGLDGVLTDDPAIVVGALER